MFGVEMRLGIWLGVISTVLTIAGLPKRGGRLRTQQKPKRCQDKDPRKDAWEELPEEQGNSKQIEDLLQKAVCGLLSEFVVRVEYQLSCSSVRGD